MKRAKLIAIMLIFMMMFSTVFASAASDPNVTIVSPAVESVVNSDSLLISLKITKPETIKVSVFEEKQLVGEELKSVDVNNIETLQAATTATASSVTTDGVAVASSVTASGVTAKFVSKEVMVPETFTSTNTLSFYTKQLNNVTPGLYKVKVDTIDAEGKVLYSTENLVVVKGVASEAEKTDLFENTQSGISQFLQNLLKSIFG
ncbi:MAG: hypothetical protein IKD13_01950 [Firmicutes bacterium]|nr:hypothetical protein [Bacillota bacterium]